MRIQVIIILFHTSLSICIISKGSEISATGPTGTYPSTSHNECVCANIPGSGVICDPDTLTVFVVMENICMFFSEELQTTLIGTCPYWFAGKLPRNISQIMEESNNVCLYQHQTGPLCGECEDNYTLSVYSYYLGCVKCESYNNGWIKFIAATFLPVTLFYIIIIAFRLSVTSSTLNAFVMIN